MRMMRIRFLNFDGNLMNIAIIHQFEVIESIKQRKCRIVNDTLRKHMYYRMETLPKVRQKRKTVFFFTQAHNNFAQS